jgi:hypothetical protein
VTAFYYDSSGTLERWNAETESAVKGRLEWLANNPSSTVVHDPRTTHVCDASSRRPNTNALTLGSSGGMVLDLTLTLTS